MIAISYVDLIGEICMLSMIIRVLSNQIDIFHGRDVNMELILLLSAFAGLLRASSQAQGTNLGI